MTAQGRVIWSEGLFLRPQHLQQQDRHMEHHVELRCASLRPWGWGFDELELEYELLSIGRVAIRRARGIFPDGTPFSMPDRDPLPVPFTVDTQCRDQVIHLALPLRSVHRKDVRWSDQPADPIARYVACDIEVGDVSGSIDDAAFITTGGLQTRLLGDQDDRSGLIDLPLLRIIEQRADSSAMLDEGFIPPVLVCRASQRLSLLVKELLGLMGQRGDLLAARMTAMQGATAEQSLLVAINRWQAELLHMAETLLDHPETLYRFMLRMAGELATFVSKGQRIGPVPSYRHASLHDSFGPLLGLIRSGLDTLLEHAAIDIPLRSRESGIWIGALHDALKKDASSFILAVRCLHSSVDLDRYLPAQAKIGPADRIRDLVNLQLPGIALTSIDKVSRDVPFLPGWHYFLLDMTSSLWGALNASRVLALHTGGGLDGLECRMWGLKG